MAVAGGEPERAIEAVERGLRAGLPGARDIEFGWPALLLGLRAAGDIAEAARARRSTTAASIVSDAEAAAQRYAARLLEEIFTDSPNPEHGAWRTLAEAELARARGNDDMDLWRLVVPQIRATERVLDVAYALMRLAACLARDPVHRTRATRAMREAHELASLAGALPLRRQIEQLARRARLHLRTEPASPRLGRDLEGISPRELEVLNLLVAGRSNRQIAEALFITEKTAGAHVSNILAKLGAASRGEAAAIAVRRGLVDV